MKTTHRHTPKQLRHWCMLAGLRPECHKWRGHHYYIGHGRRWRLNCHGEWQISCRDFDRWANSVEATVPLPRYEQEFLAVVAHMRSNALLGVLRSET